MRVAREGWEGVSALWLVFGMVLPVMLPLSLLLGPVLECVGFGVDVEALESCWRAGGVPRMFGSVIAVKRMEEGGKTVCYKLGERLDCIEGRGL